MLQGDGGCDVDVARRTAMARRTFNELYWMWSETQLPLQLKLRIFETNILNRVVWGSEGWLLTDAVIRQLNGWCSRCLSRITGKTPREEASARTQTMCLPGIIRYRRMKWLGHLLRNDPGDLTRQLLLRYAEVEARGMISVEGSILMDAPAYNTKDQLVALAGGSGSVKEREEARKQWKAWTMRHLCEGDRARMRKRSTPSDKKDREITANTPVETANVLRDTEHDWRLYSDGCWSTSRAAFLDFLHSLYLSIRWSTCSSFISRAMLLTECIFIVFLGTSTGLSFCFNFSAFFRLLDSSAFTRAPAR